jgi:hypothetical protein
MHFAAKLPLPVDDFIGAGFTVLVKPSNQWIKQ